MTDLVAVSLLGGILALDATSVGQFMVSRPMVAGLLAGWLMGDPATGVFVGALLELYLLVSFPSGGARFPEGPTATVVAVAAALSADAPAAIPIAVAAGLVWGQVGGFTITRLRKLNGRLLPRTEPSAIRRVGRAHLLSVGLDFLRGAGVTGVGVALSRTLMDLAQGAWPLDDGPSSALLMAGGSVSGGILLHSLGGFRKRRTLFAAGIALGLVGARFL